MEFDRLRTNPLIPTMREHRGALEYRLAKLRDDERKLTNGRITALQFLDLNIHSADGIIDRAIERQGTIDDTDDEIEEDNEEEIEQPNNVNMVPAVPKCLSCGIYF